MASYYEEANYRILIFSPFVLNQGEHSGIQQGFEMQVFVDQSPNSFICVAVNLHVQIDLKSLQKLTLSGSRGVSSKV